MSYLHKDRGSITILDFYQHCYFLDKNIDAGDVGIDDVSGVGGQRWNSSFVRLL
jgi:hypothetical protein